MEKKSKSMKQSFVIETDPFDDINKCMCYHYWSESFKKNLNRV